MLPSFHPANPSLENTHDRMDFTKIPHELLPSIALFQIDSPKNMLMWFLIHPKLFYENMYVRKQLTDHLQRLWFNKYYQEYYLWNGSGGHSHGQDCNNEKNRHHNSELRRNNLQVHLKELFQLRVICQGVKTEHLLALHRGTILQIEDNWEAMNRWIGDYMSLSTLFQMKFTLLTDLCSVYNEDYKCHLLKMSYAFKPCNSSLVEEHSVNLNQITSYRVCIHIHFEIRTSMSLGSLQDAPRSVLMVTTTSQKIACKQFLIQADSNDFKKGILVFIGEFSTNVMLNGNSLPLKFMYGVSGYTYSEEFYLELK
ncbi:hypothetical protein C9374_004035 [Naegleria lovaniensis]|uniref:Uncharacterized protein n=1 Tax=Naegleria lovaniensis TaxID=51637 RepID=A0AA88H944_NAELO|nr:uncharacterized protein C9374_004035 [Naegleria lovaniensis]KAG2394271.1 hypothetical protein C9374_004035 [Naegleria lovaniensis]